MGCALCTPLAQWRSDRLFPPCLRAPSRAARLTAVHPALHLGPLGRPLPFHVTAPFDSTAPFGSHFRILLLSHSARFAFCSHAGAHRCSECSRPSRRAAPSATSSPTWSLRSTTQTSAMPRPPFRHRLQPPPAYFRHRLPPTATHPSCYMVMDIAAPDNHRQPPPPLPLPTVATWSWTSLSGGLSSIT